VLDRRLSVAFSQTTPSPGAIEPTHPNMLSNALFWTGLNLVPETYHIQIHLRLSVLIRVNLRSSLNSASRYNSTSRQSLSTLATTRVVSGNPFPETPGCGRQVILPALPQFQCFGNLVPETRPIQIHLRLSVFIRVYLRSSLNPASHYNRRSRQSLSTLATTWVVLARMLSKALSWTGMVSNAETGVFEGAWRRKPLAGQSVW